LAVIYLGLVLAAQTALQVFTGQAGQEPVVIVASTLLVVALFAPLRSGVQAAIDKRFYRRKYDVERTLALFGRTLRTEVDLEQLKQQLLRVVEETMQPTRVFLWLRQPPGDSSSFSRSIADRTTSAEPWAHTGAEPPC